METDEHTARHYRRNMGAGVSRNSGGCGYVLDDTCREEKGELVKDPETKLEQVWRSLIAIGLTSIAWPLLVPWKKLITKKGG